MKFPASKMGRAALASAVLFASFGLGGVGGVAMGYYRWNSYVPPPYSVSRSFFVISHAQQFGDADTLIIGDSLVEQTDFTGACGRTFAAGIGGSRIEEPLKRIPELLSATSPETIVVSLGSNFFAAGNELSDLRQQYEPLLDTLGQRRIILVGISNSVEGNAHIEQVAKARGHAFVTMPTDEKIADGLHYTPAGARELKRRVSEACI